MSVERHISELLIFTHEKQLIIGVEQHREVISVQIRIECPTNNVVPPIFVFYQGKWDKLILGVCIVQPIQNESKLLKLVQVVLVILKTFQWVEPRFEIHDVEEKLQKLNSGSFCHG